MDGVATVRNTASPFLSCRAQMKACAAYRGVNFAFTPKEARIVISIINSTKWVKNSIVHHLDICRLDLPETEGRFGDGGVDCGKGVAGVGSADYSTSDESISGFNPR